jgi:hypothetical protein
VVDPELIILILFKKAILPTAPMHIKLSLPRFAVRHYPPFSVYALIAFPLAVFRKLHVICEHERTIQ